MACCCRASPGPSYGTDWRDRAAPRWTSPNYPFKIHHRTIAFLTPQDERSTLYFWCSARDFALESEETDQQIRAAVEYAFGQEDKPMIEDVQRNMAGRSFEEMKPLLLPFDRGAVFTRRMLADLIAGKKQLLPTSTRGALAAG